ncbi:hypothetical protein B0H14DRAFT_295738 [Mycena olivaceomarginata]|nr:hypothetical protein B0H14DRAFT_295738 [Mycena olivaceomarginata]
MPGLRINDCLYLDLDQYPTPPTTAPTAAKRKYDEIVASFPAPTAKKKKAKRSPNAARSTAERFNSMARYLTRGFHPFLDIGLVLQEGCEHHWGTPVSDTPSNTIQVPASELLQQVRRVAAFDEIFSLAPDLLDVVKLLFAGFESDPDSWNAFVTTMRASANSGRVGDTGGLKHALNYVLPDITKYVLVPAIAKGESKSSRGLAHPILCHLILGWTDRLKLPHLDLPTIDPETGKIVQTLPAPADTSPNEFLDRILNGNVEISNDELPSFLWAHGSFDPNNYDKGLLRGELLL